MIVKHTHTQLGKVEETEAWLRTLAAKGRSKKLSDGISIKENLSSEVTDRCLSEAGVDAIRQVTLMAAPRVLSANYSETSSKEASGYSRMNTLFC